MTISGISNSFSIAQLTQVGSTRHSSSSTRSVDGSAPPEPAAGGGLVDAIVQALAQIGVTGSSSSTGTSTSADSSTSDSSSSTASTSDTASGTEDVSQALGAFLQNLMQSLHAQSDTGSSSD